MPAASLPHSGCQTLPCNQTFTLELVLEVDREQLTVSDTATMTCVF